MGIGHVAEASVAAHDGDGGVGQAGAATFSYVNFLPAMRHLRAAGGCPNSTEPVHFEEMRKHFTDVQIIEIVARITMGGFLNRWKDTIATVTDQESVDFARRVLGPVG